MYRQLSDLVRLLSNIESDLSARVSDTIESQNGQMLKIKCPIFFFVETAFLTMITGTAPLSSYHFWNSTAASLATLSSSDCAKTVFIGWQYRASCIGFSCFWYCNNSNPQIVYSKSGTSPIWPNLSPRCPNKFFMSEPSSIIGCWPDLSISTRSRNIQPYRDLSLCDHPSVKHPFCRNCSRHFAKGSTWNNLNTNLNSKSPDRRISMTQQPGQYFSILPCLSGSIYVGISKIIQIC